MNKEYKLVESLNLLEIFQHPIWNDIWRYLWINESIIALQFFLGHLWSIHWNQGWWSNSSIETLWG